MKHAVCLFIAALLISPTAFRSMVAAEDKEGPFVIHDIAPDPQNPKILYAVTSNYGVLKSSDGGATWRLSNQGLRSYTHHAVVVDPQQPQTVYVGAWGGGVSKSVDQGAHWIEMNDRLGNTAIEDLTLDPAHPQRLFAATTGGVFLSSDGGTGWEALNEGLPVTRIDLFKRILALPSGPAELLLGTNQGLFKRDRGAAGWDAIEEPVARQRITALAVHPTQPDRLYAGTAESGLLHSRNGGMHWSRFESAVGNSWVTDIAIDPLHPEILYVSTRADGILNSRDGGRIWRAVNDGLPVRDVRSLAIDPKHPNILYAGTTHDGLFKTSDGGDHWTRLTGYPLLTHTEIVTSVSGPDPSREHPSSLPIPPEFFKCNQCHGWTDPLLNAKQTYWRVPSNERDWAPTMERMSLRAHLTPEEAGKILAFLTEYTQGKQSAESSESPEQIVRRVCGRCHALQIAGNCLAGDCRGNRVVQVLMPLPWDFAVDWMKSMGAGMTETEEQAIRAYLEETYPAKPYPLRWMKVEAELGNGGWNVVSLMEHQGRLYAGFEGNGTIFRSADGVHWMEAVNTGQYTVYGITPFQGALYAGTNNPNPQIWRSRDGERWEISATLPGKEKGVFSLGAFKDHLYAGTGRGRIYRSSDGVRWEQVGDLKQVSAAGFEHWVRFLIPFKDHLYAGLEQGPLYRTPDGLHWERIEQPITGQKGARGATVFRSELYVGTTGGGAIWRTKDGVTWERVFTVPPDVQRGYVAAMTVTGETLYAGVDGYVFRTADGTHWEEVGHISPHTIEAMAGFQNDLYAGTLIPPQAHIYRASIFERHRRSRAP
jgi:photosystem II stability/assembly factor-like uncharacterized protein